MRPIGLAVFVALSLMLAPPASEAQQRRQAEHLTAAFGKDTPLADITSARIADYKATRLATKSRQFKAPLSAAAVNRPGRSRCYAICCDWHTRSGISSPRSRPFGWKTSPRVGCAGSRQKRRTGCSRPPERATIPT